MNTIRYYSKFGHTKSMVEAVKDLLDSEPRTVDVPLEGKVDVLYIGAGVMMGKVDRRVMDFIGSLTPEMVEAVGECLNKNELIKIGVLKNCIDDPREIGQTIAERTHSTLVQVIGKKIVLYKPDKDKPKIELPKASKQ